jgi:hypothetical protein
LQIVAHLLIRDISGSHPVFIYSRTCDVNLALSSPPPPTILQIVAHLGESGSTRTPIPAQGGQQSGDCGQQVMAA